MQFSVALVAAIGFLSTAAAMRSPIKRQDPAAIVYMCQDTRSKGNCQAQDFPLGKCTQFSNGYAGATKSNQNLSHNVKCTWYLTDDCTGDSYSNQNDQNLTDGNGKFSHMRSGKCDAS